MTKIQLSKSDAALRQLKTAISLFMKDGDSVSIHTLANAAQEILEKLASKHNIQSMRQLLLGEVVPDKREYVEKKLFEAKNYFKHASRDAQKLLEFNPEINEWVLYDAARLYALLTQEKVPILVAFGFWMFSKYPQLFILEESQRKIMSRIVREFNVQNKNEFLKIVPLLEDITYGQD